MQSRISCLAHQRVSSLSDSLVASLVASLEALSQELVS